VATEQYVGPRRGARWLVAVYGLLGSLLVAYAIALLSNSSGQTAPWLDAWGVAAFEFVVAALCAVRAVRSRQERGFTAALALAVTAWAIGDLALAIESMGGRSAPVPSLADGFYLAFYPLTYLALMLLLRREVRAFSASTWLDGAIAGLGTAAVCAAFAFRSIAHTAGGNAIGVATNLAYPIGDVLLMALVVAGSATIPIRRRATWLLVAAGCAINVLGDTVNLFSASIATSRADSIVNGVAWPTALLLMSLAVWVRPEPSRRPRVTAPPGFVLPGLAALAALAVLSFGTVRHLSWVALSLSIATLLVVGARMVGSLSSIRALMAERQQQAVTDVLTGLGNRRKLAEALEAHFLGDDTSASLAFLYIDLNHFKEINDAFGHSAGDELLRQLGPRLRGALRDADLLLRIGGDELAVVLPGVDARGAEVTAGALSARFTEPFDLEVVRVRVGASIGIAEAPRDARDALGLLRSADAAMYRAKRDGLRYAVYSPALDDVDGRLRLAEDLHGAIHDDHLELHYQPQMVLDGSAVPAVEALLRWMHPVHGPIEPMAFLGLAEEAGLMPALTTLVLQKAIGQAAAWRAEGRPTGVAVNISASNLLDAAFTHQVARLIRESGLPAGLLTLEITETTVIEDFDRSREVIADLHALGVRISIDDFGAGFTSLAYLGRLTIDELKLDRTFVQPLVDGPDSQARALLRATLELGHSMGLCVVAEGVEDHDTFELLVALGCDRVQGYLISRPVPAAEVDYAVRGPAPKKAVTAPAVPV
jgi:diguanylate cyclase (GGDEF)-like protein